MQTLKCDELNGLLISLMISIVTKGMRYYIVFAYRNENQSIRKREPLTLTFVYNF